MPDGDIKMDMFINPLSFVEANGYVHGRAQKKPTYEEVLRYLCGAAFPHDLDTLLARYETLSKKEQARFDITPVVREFTEGLVWPLHHAKASYLLGNYLGTIAVCGMVCEMLAMLLYEMHPFFVDGKPISRSGEEKVFGGKFQDLPQKRRVGILHTFGLMKDEIKGRFDSVRDTRNKYLHPAPNAEYASQADAEDVYVSTLFLLVKVTGYTIRSGKICFAPQFLKWLRRRGSATEK